MFSFLGEVFPRTSKKPSFPASGNQRSEQPHQQETRLLDPVKICFGVGFIGIFAVSADHRLFHGLLVGRGFTRGFPLRNCALSQHFLYHRCFFLFHGAESRSFRKSF